MIGRASFLSSVESTTASMGATPAKVTPLTKGSRAPMFQRPSVWRKVARPAVKRQAPVRKVSSVALRPTAAPTMSGGATSGSSAPGPKSGRSSASRGEIRPLGSTRRW